MPPCQYPQVMHQQQVDEKKKVLSAASGVDDMYDMLAAYEQKVSCFSLRFSRIESFVFFSSLAHVEEVF